MNSKNSLTIIFLLLFTLFSYGQTRSTKATKIILVVHEKSDVVEHLELLSTIQKMNQNELRTAYPEHKFFLGVLKGTYKLDKKKIIPGSNTTVIMYTEKQFAPSEQFLKSADLHPGDDFKLGKTKAKVITNKEGELTIKTQNI